jgi:hypothetical protein
MFVITVIDCDEASPGYGCTVDVQVPAFYPEMFDAEGWSERHRVRLVGVERVN